MNVRSDNFSSNWLALVCLTFGASSFSVFFLFDPLFDSRFNADAAYLLLLTKDLIFSKASLSDWFLAPHFYIFPDTLLVTASFLLNAAGLDALLASVLVWSLAAIALLAYAWQVATGDRLRQGSIVAFAILGMVFISAHFADLGELQHSLSLNHLVALGQILAPALHGGAFFTSLVIFFLIRSFLMNLHSLPSKIVLLTAVFVITILTTISDVIFVPWGAAPVSIFIISQFRIVAARKLLIALASTLFSTAFGCLIWWLLREPSQAIYMTQITGYWVSSFNALAALFRSAVFCESALVTFFFAVNAIIVIAAIGFFFSSGQTSSHALCQRQLVIFLASLVISSTAFAVVMGLYRNNQVRFLLPYIVIAPFAFFFMLSLLARNFLQRRHFLSVVGLIALMIMISGPLNYAKAAGPTPWQLARCLSQLGLESGMAEYWDASPLVATSSGVLRIVTLNPDGKLEPYRRMTKRAWIDDYLDGRTKMQFLILPEARSMLHVKGFDKATVCGGRLILLHG